MVDYTGLDREITFSYLKSADQKRYAEKIAPSPMGDGFVILHICLDDKQDMWRMYGVGDLRLTYDSFEKMEAMWYRTLLRRCMLKKICDLRCDYKVDSHNGLF